MGWDMQISWLRYPGAMDVGRWAAALPLFTDRWGKEGNTGQ